MKKLVFLAASAAIVLASCAKIETGKNIAEIDVPVSLGAYTGTSRAKVSAYLPTRPPVMQHLPPQTSCTTPR